MVINKENIEEYLLLLIDGELSAADEMEVMTFIESHKEYQVLLDQYLETKLEMEDIVFEDKEALLKPEENVVSFRKRKTILFAAAGITAVLLAGTVFKLMMHNEASMQPSIGIHTEPKANVDSSAKNTLAMSSKTNPPNAVVTSSNAVASTSVVKNKVMKQQTSASNITAELKAAQHEEPIQPLSVAALKEVDITNETQINEAPLPVVALDFHEEEKKNNGMLPDASRLEGLNDLLSQVETLKDKIADKSKVFKNMTVAIRLGNKEFTIGK